MQRDSAAVFGGLAIVSAYGKVVFHGFSHRKKLWPVLTSFGIASSIFRRRRRGCADVGSVLCFPHLHSLFSFGIRKNTWVSP
jgi:hypothetical protein